MQIYSDADQVWNDIATWNVSLTARVWSELTNRGTSFSHTPEGAVHQHEAVHPPDLHKYTGSKEPIPEKGLGASPSYLDYPKE
jgi:hypothetical protein